MTLSLWEEQSTRRDKRTMCFFQNDELQGWSFLLTSVSSATTAEVLSERSLLSSTAVLFLHENTDHVTGIHKSNQGEEYLDSAVNDL